MGVSRRTTQLITLIAAVAKNGVIGLNNTIPWHLPEDFKHFSATTRGHAVIMGSKTFWSLPEAFRPLPKRTNIVLTKTGGAGTAYGATWVHTFEDAVREAREIHGQEEVYVIGGATIYEQTIGKADRLVISEVDMEPEGDTFFPVIGPEWTVSDRDEREGFAIVTYVRG